jgi:hypothetical protein
VVTYSEVKELLEGRGFRPGEEENPTVLNIVLERFMHERGVETYDDLNAAFTDAGYQQDLDTFLDACEGTMDSMTIEFVRDVTDVLALDEDEKLALAWGHLWGSK